MDKLTRFTIENSRFTIMLLIAILIGGASTYLMGFVLLIGGLWFFFDSVYLTTGHPGLLSSGIRGAVGRGGGAGPARGGTLTPVHDRRRPRG